jgi:HlyD family secretion protein
MKRILIGFTVLLLLSTAGYAVVTWRGRQESAAQLQPLASSLVVNERLVAEAKVVPVQSAALGLPDGGRVAEALVREGDLVQAGQLLVRLDRGRAEANVAQAEAQLAQAQAAYKQLRAGATPEEIAATEPQLRAAQAQLRQTSGSVTAADRIVAAAQQAQANLAELRAGPKPADLRSAEAQLAQAQQPDHPARPALSR